MKLNCAWRVWLVPAALLIASCAKREPLPPAPQTVRISQRNEPTDLDPATASLPDEFFIIRALSEGLLVPNPDGGEPLPAAAERYEVSADGLTYTFHLRKGALWSNGDPVVAEDFVASFRRVLTPATGAPKAHLVYAVKNARAFVTGALTDFHAVGIQAEDPQTLAITLAVPNANFPRYVASGPWIPVNPRIVAEQGRAWTQPEHYVGNGPFTLAEWRPQQQIVVRRNPKYWNAAHVRTDELRFVRFDNNDTEERAYRARQIDVTMTIPQTKIASYARDHPAEFHRAPLAETRFFAFNTTRRPLTDERVRRALSLAIDRDRLVRDVLLGGQTPANRFLSPALLRSNRTAGADRSDQSFNPDEARRLLAEAGFSNGRGFPALELAGWDHNPVLEATQQMWRRELGIEVQIVIQEAKVHLAALNSGNYDIAFVTNLLDVPDPVAALGDFTRAAPNNFPHWRSAEYDERLNRAAAESDRAKADADLKAAENLLLDSAAIAPVYFNAQNWLMAPNVRGWEQDALWSRRYNDLRFDR